MARHSQTAPDSAVAAALDVAERMQDLADAGSWQDVEALVQDLKDAVVRVPDAERAAVVHALQTRLDAVADTVGRAREDVGGKLAKLRRGQEAKKAYDVSQ